MYLRRIFVARFALCLKLLVFETNKQTTIDVSAKKILRSKGAQKINFEQFCQALKEVSKKRFPSKSAAEAEEAIFKLVENKTPGTNATTVSTSELLVNKRDTEASYEYSTAIPK